MNKRQRKKRQKRIQERWEALGITVEINRSASRQVGQLDPRALIGDPSRASRVRNYDFSKMGDRMDFLRDFGQPGGSD